MRQGTGRRIAAAALGVACVVGLFVLLYSLSIHAYPGDSDGATVILEGQAMAQGHPALAGWALSLDSFWTVDVLWYLVAVLIAGVQPALLYAIPAAIAVVAIVLGVVIACQERRGGAAIAAGGTVVAILALPSHALALFFLRGPLHVGTVLWCLVAFVALRRGRWGLGVPVAALFLAAAMLGDLQALALGTVPVFLAGLTAMARSRSLRAGAPLIVAALGSVVIAEVVRRIAHIFGTFSIAQANPIATFHQMLHNVPLALHQGLSMMGVRGAYFGLAGEPTALSYVHILAVLVVLAALGGGVATLVWGVVRGRPTVVGASTEAAWRLDDLLVFATLACPVAYVILSATTNAAYARYLTSGIISGAILAGRVVGRVAAGVRWTAVLRAAAAVGIAATACYAAGAGYQLSQTPPANDTARLAVWLESHHLTSGLGAYWSASIVTVQSRGAVKVRPVVSIDGRLYRWDRNSANYWYGGAGVRFVVFSIASPWGGVDAGTAVATFGQPERAYTEYGYEVLVWKNPISLP